MDKKIQILIIKENKKIKEVVTIFGIPILAVVVVVVVVVVVFLQ